MAVIGKPTRNVSPEDALGHVFGCTCGNDLSTRDLQFVRGEQWLLSKTFDGFAPMGPWVAVGLDPRDLAISSAVNVELRQNARTSDLIFDVAHIISDLSHHFTPPARRCDLHRHPLRRYAGLPGGPEALAPARRPGGCDHRGHRHPDQHFYLSSRKIRRACAPVFRELLPEEEP